MGGGGGILGTVISIGTAIYTGGASLALGTKIALNVGASLVASALAPKPKASSLGSKSYQDQTTNRSLMVKEPITTRETVYGITKKSGSILFMDTTDNNRRLHLVVEIASHEINNFGTTVDDRFFFNEESIQLGLLSKGGGGYTDPDGIYRYTPTAGSYNEGSDYNPNNKKVEVKFHKGSDDQLSDYDLRTQVSKWTTNHRLRGISYIYVQMEYDTDMFPNGIPNISTVVQGKKLYDFRTDTTAFSRNPALCIYDYLTDTRLGLGVNPDNIDITSFTTMANLCDEDVTKVGGGTEKRYLCDGIVYSDTAPMQVLDDMLTSCAGVLSYSNGKFILKGGQYVAPTLTLTDDDFISQISIESKKSRKNLFNTVKGIFTSSETSWQPTDYPIVTSSTFTDADGETIYGNIDLPFTTSSATAQRIAKIALFKNRQQIVVSAQVKMSGFKLQVGDTVNVTNSRLGWTDKVFEIAEWSFNTNDTLGINLIMVETASSVYDWDAEESEFVADNTTLPTVQTVTAPAIVVTDELRVYSESPITVLKVVCSSSQGTTNEFEVEALNNNDPDGEYVTLGRSKHNIFELVNAEDGAVYTVRARSINSFNVHSSYVTADHEVVGKTAPPNDVEDFSSNVIGDVVALNWTPVPDLDLSHYIIRHTPITVSPKFEEGIIVARKVAKPANSILLPAKTGTYMIKAIDVLGIESENSAKSVIILNSITRDYNIVSSSTESPDFTGAKQDVEVVTRDGTNYLELIHAVLFDDGVGTFDDDIGLFDDGGQTAFNTEGTYDFPLFDLGAVFNSRVTFTCKFERHDESSLFDSQSGLFDSYGGLFDGLYTEHNDINVELLISTSEDNITYTDYRTYILGDYTARYIKLRVKLTTTTQVSCPAIYELSASVDMQNRTIADNDLVSGTSPSGYTVTFSPAMKLLEGLSIASQNLDQNERYNITAKDETGFTIIFYQGSGTGTVISREFDYVAKGYGYVES